MSLQGFLLNPSLRGYSMAPILKEAESPLAATNSAATPAPHAKSPTEGPARPQPIPLEIPVTVNGARTVDGSAKREPFSEATLTVLVFPLGAVIRLATPLVPGQLVFLTNAKTKKEVVCQVVKSKSGGTTSGYVELRFTEPAPGFWGLQVPGPSASPTIPRPPAPVGPATLQAISPARALAAKLTAPNPIEPVPAFLTPAIPVLAPPPSPALKAEPVTLESVTSGNPAPSLSVPPPPPVAAILEARPTQHNETVAAAAPAPPAPTLPPASASTAIPSASIVPPPAIPVPPLPDYSKEINALFAVPQAPISTPTFKTLPEPTPGPSSSSPSSEELKLQAARLQAQLSSLLFTETLAAPPVPAASPSTPVAAPPADVVAKKVLEVPHEPARVAKTEPKPAVPARKPMPAPLALNEEVRIPSWLAPLSQNSEPSIVEPAAPVDVPSVSDSAVSLNSVESREALAVDGEAPSQAGVFGGQLLGEFSGPQEQAAPTGSKKGLFIGIAAALLLLGGGAWYYQKNYSRPTTVAPARPASSPSSVAPVPVSELSATRRDSTTGINIVNPATPTPSQALSKSSKNPEPVPTQAVFNPAPDLRNSEPAGRNASPVEPPKKPALGDVRLAAPVVNRGANSQQAAIALPSIEGDASPAGSDPLAAVDGIHNKMPDAPRPVGGDVKPAQLLKTVAPVYPPIARTQRVSGNVQIDAFIDPSGNVASVKVISGPPILHNAALEAVKQWKYAPALLDGQPTSMHLTVTVQFRTQ